jgi:hypothetical protein
MFSPVSQILRLVMTPNTERMTNVGAARVPERGRKLPILQSLGEDDWDKGLKNIEGRGAVFSHEAKAPTHSSPVQGQ